MKDAKKKKKKGKKRPRSEETAAPKVEVSLDNGISAVAAAGCSWGSAFAAAAQIEPAEGLDDDEFLQRTDTSTQIDAGLAKISQLAAVTKIAAPTKQETVAAENDTPAGGRSENAAAKAGGNDTSSDTKSHKRKREEEDSSDGRAEEEPTSLEGRMVPHPHKSSEQVMVLVDSKRSIVYSAMDRTSSGDYIRIGAVVNGDICWDDGAFAQQGTQSHCPRKLHVSKPALFRPTPWQVSVKYHAIVIQLKRKGGCDVCIIQN